MHYNVTRNGVCFHREGKPEFCTIGAMVQNSGLPSLWKQNLFEASKQGIKIYKVDNTLGSKKWFDLDLWTCDLKINRDHLLIGRNPCTKFDIDQLKWSKDTEQTTQWAEKSGLTLTFEQVTWKSIGIIFSLKATPASSWYWSSEGVKRYWADNTWSTDRPTDWQLQNNMSPFSRGA